MSRRRRAPENAPVNLQRVWYQIHPEAPTFDVWEALCGVKQGRTRCVLQQGHASSRAHSFVTASMYQYGRAGGKLPPNWVLIPKNGNWDDLTFENWEPMPRKEYAQSRFRRPQVRQEHGWAQRGGVWHKTCTECGIEKPVERFPTKRNQCTECWAEIRRERRNAAYATCRDQGCTIVKGHHFHVGKLGAPQTPEQREAAQLLGAVTYLLEPSGRLRV